MIKGFIEQNILIVLCHHSGLGTEPSLFEQLDSGIRRNDGLMNFHGKKFKIKASGTSAFATILSMRHTVHSAYS